MELINAIHAAKQALKVEANGLKKALRAVPFSPADVLICQDYVDSATKNVADLEALQIAMF